MNIQVGIFFALPFPETQGVVIKGATVIGLKLGKAAEPLDDLIGLSRRAIESSGEKKIATGVGRIEVGPAKQGLHCVVVITACVEGGTETNHQARRIRVTLGGLLEDLYGRVQSAMKQKLRGPVEEIALGRIGVRGQLELVGGGDKVAVFFLDLAEQIVQFRGVFLLQQSHSRLASLLELAGD